MFIGISQAETFVNTLALLCLVKHVLKVMKLTIPRKFNIVTGIHEIYIK